MSHLYLNEESDHSEENTCKNEVFRSTIFNHRKVLNIPNLQPIYYIQYQNKKFGLLQIPEAIGGILWKKVFFKI